MPHVSVNRERFVDDDCDADCDRIVRISWDMIVPKGIAVGKRLCCIPAVTAPWQS
jgi:hypothetical protein